MLVRRSRWVLLYLVARSVLWLITDREGSFVTMLVVHVAAVAIVGLLYGVVASLAMRATASAQAAYSAATTISELDGFVPPHRRAPDSHHGPVEDDLDTHVGWSLLKLHEAGFARIGSFEISDPSGTRIVAALRSSDGTVLALLGKHTLGFVTDVGGRILSTSDVPRIAAGPLVGDRVPPWELRQLLPRPAEDLLQAHTELVRAALRTDDAATSFDSTEVMATIATIERARLDDDTRARHLLHADAWSEPRVQRRAIASFRSADRLIDAWRQAAPRPSDRSSVSV